MRWQARRFTLSLQSAKIVAKFWRPSILLIAPEEPDTNLLAFCSDLKKGGLLILGKPIIAPAVDEGDGLARALEEKALLLEQASSGRPANST